MNILLKKYLKCDLAMKVYYVSPFLLLLVVTSCTEINSQFLLVVSKGFTYETSNIFLNLTLHTAVCAPQLQYTQAYSNS